MKTNLSAEECELRKRRAMESRGIDYDRYLESMRQREIQKHELGLFTEYRHNHEDDVQFGCCPPDVIGMNDYGCW